MKPFYNTTGMTGEALKAAIQKAEKQEDAILLMFLHTRKAYGPSKVMELMIRAGKTWPITSIRRALTNLTQKGDLVKMPEMVQGMYGDKEHKWQLNFKKYPMQGGEQTELFKKSA